MNEVFADTYFSLAALNPDDRSHEIARALSEGLFQSIVTTGFVLTEVGDALAAPVQRTVFVDLLGDLRHDSSFFIVPTSEELFNDGAKLFGVRLDKEWSLTDCISFHVMKSRKIREALTADHHFKQAGFSILM